MRVTFGFLVLVVLVAVVVIAWVTGLFGEAEDGAFAVIDEVPGIEAEAGAGEAPDPGGAPAEGPVAGSPDQPGGSPEQPGEWPEAPGEAPEQPSEPLEEPGGSPEGPGSVVDDPADPLGAVAGEYRLVEASAREALGPVVVEYQWAEGALVVDADGLVSGEVTYWYRDWEGQDCRTDAPKLCFLPQSEFDGTVVAAQLEATGGGLMFAGTMVVLVRVTERNHPGLGLLPPITREMEMPITGVVDPAAGTISLSQGDSGPGTVIFRR